MFYFGDGGLIANFSNPLMWVELLFTISVIFFIDFVTLKTLKRSGVKLIVIVLSIGLLVSFLFSLMYLWMIILALMIIALTIFYSVNIGTLRPYVANTLSSKSDNKISSLFKRNKNKNGVGKLYDRIALYDKIEQTVRQLSLSKTGGLITFERETELTDYAKSGTILNSPVTPELLVTIFYPGTRLHDGAVIIRDDLIYAAAVYYDPITSGLTGKYGSRHRAALGISKATDSVTVVVSEETGRISLAVAGELIHVPLEEFRRMFEEYMSSEITDK